MTPPQLPADVPVAHVGHPVFPHLDEPVGQDLRPAGASRGQRGGGKGRHPDEPLGLEARLHDIVRALAVSDQHFVRLDRLQIAAGL
jgi:hypothetical protein